MPSGIAQRSSHPGQTRHCHRGPHGPLNVTENLDSVRRACSVLVVGTPQGTEVPEVLDLDCVLLLHPVGELRAMVIVDHNAPDHELESSWDAAMKYAWDHGLRGPVRFEEPYAESGNLSVYLIDA